MVNVAVVGLNYLRRLFQPEQFHDDPCMARGRAPDSRGRCHLSSWSRMAVDKQRQPEGSNAEMMDLPNAATPAPSRNRMWACLLLKAVLDCAFWPRKFRKLPCWAMHAPPGIPDSSWSRCNCVAVGVSHGSLQHKGSALSQFQASQILLSALTGEAVVLGVTDAPGLEKKAKKL